MGKITRFIGNLAAFASAATGTNRTIFGPKGTPTQSDDITANINPDYLGGWELLGPSDKPTKQQFNALGFTHGQLLAYLHQMGIAEWDGVQEYQIGSIANRAGVLYSCKTADHVSVTPPESDPANWDKVVSVSDFTEGQLLSSHGYQLLPGGLIIQWATVATPTAAGGTSPFLYPIAFPNALLAVADSIDLAPGVGERASMSVNNRGLSGATLQNTGDPLTGAISPTTVILLGY